MDWSKIALQASSFLDSIQQKTFIEKSNNVMSNMGLSDGVSPYVRMLILLVIGVVISAFLWWVTRQVLIRVLHGLAYKSKTKWDDYLVKNKFFSALSHLMPFLFIDFMIAVIFHDFPLVAEFLIRLTDIVIIIITLYIIMRFLNTARDVLVEKPRLADKPIGSYFQLTKIVISGFLIILMISVAFNVDLFVILTSMGALTAILILVFKDTILGFVGSIQLAANDMIRIGDWVTMEKFGADGDVVAITLATVKIQNFDKTITTIPTYSFISDSFKNWRGMMDSDGRRVMRALNIKIESVKFCSSELLHQIGEIELIRDYISQKELDIENYNAANEVNKAVLLNGRNQTNLGIFRYYIIQYLESNPAINNKMTLMVRQLSPTEKGVPLQLYAFTKTQDWAEYEEVLADIFDHLFAAVKYFDLELFETPSGSDVRRLAINT